MQTPKVPLKDYIGEYSYLGTTLRQANIEPQPSLSDVRRVLTEFAILPLGSKEVHDSAPHIKVGSVYGYQRGCSIAASSIFGNIGCSYRIFGEN